MPDDVIYMTPLPANEGTIYMEPLGERSGVIYMYKTDPTTGGEPIAGYEWRMIGIYSFQGVSCSTSWTLTGGAGIYTGAAGLIITDAVKVQIIPRSGSWWDGSHYRGMMDVKTAVAVRHIGYDWTGTFYGWTSSVPAAAYWLTAGGSIAIGDDRVFCWGGYDTNPLDNTGLLTFSLLGQFIR
jgi:hypothetical protein